MDRLTFVLILLGGLMTSGFLWYWYHGPSKSPHEDPTNAYRWDFEGPCNPKEQQQTCVGQSNPISGNNNLQTKKERVCDGKGITPELQCQIKIMSRAPPKTACPLFSNPYSLPNLASFYLGARASVLKNTTTYSGCRGEWCDDVIFLNSIIQPGLLIVGKNFRFKGNRGSILIELAVPGIISGITLIHPLTCEIPNGYYASAPKDFVVYGLGNEGFDDSLELGRYMYQGGGPRAQTFPVMSKCIGTEAHKRILINFEDNYGNPYYTAIYKIEVHGMFEDNDNGRAMSCSECG